MLQVVIIPVTDFIWIVTVVTRIVTDLIIPVTDFTTSVTGVTWNANGAGMKGLRIEIN